MWIKPIILEYDTEELIKKISAKSWSVPSNPCGIEATTDDITCQLTSPTGDDGGGSTGPSDPGFEEIICLFALSWCGMNGIAFECKDTAACKTDEPY